MKFYYLFRFQYLGFRYHGWLKQTSRKTVQESIEEALQHVLETTEFQIIGSSRTDSMVSAQENFFELITEKECIDREVLCHSLNKCLPPDIKILEVKPVSKEFKIIGSSRLKEYHYFFSFGEKLHPFCAPYMAMINEDLNIDLMKEAARLFEGEHDFSNFCYRLKDNQSPVRKIEMSVVETNRDLTASFFPAKSFVFKVRGRSFLRHQVRLMMGALFMVGMKRISVSELEAILKGDSGIKIMTAPASGLILQRIEFSD